MGDRKSNPSCPLNPWWSPHPTPGWTRQTRDARQTGWHLVWRQSRQLLRKPIPTLHSAFCLSRSTSRNRPLTCTGSNERVVNSGNFHGDGSTGKSSPWGRRKELLRTLPNTQLRHRAVEMGPQEWLLNTHPGDFTHHLRVLLNPALFPSLQGGKPGLEGTNRSLRRCGQTPPNFTQQL